MLMVTIPFSQNNNTWDVEIRIGRAIDKPGTYEVTDGE